MIENNNGKMYDTLEDLVKLKGVGNKIAILVLQSFYKKNITHIVHKK